MTDEELQKILIGAKAPFANFGQSITGAEFFIAKKIMENFTADEGVASLLELLNDWKENRPPTITEIRQKIFAIRREQQKNRNWEEQRARLNYQTYPDPIRQQCEVWAKFPELYQKTYNRPFIYLMHYNYLKSIGGGYDTGKILKSELSNG